MNSAIMLCLVTGLMWAGAPILGRLSGVNAMMMASLIACGTLLATLPVAFSQNYAATSWKSLGFGLVAGVLNGIGLLAFYSLVAGSNKGLWELSRVAPICYVLVPIFLGLGMKMLFSEAITNDKLIGVALACGAIWFLTK